MIAQKCKANKINEFKFKKKLLEHVAQGETQTASQSQLFELRSLPTTQASHLVFVSVLIFTIYLEIC